MRSEGKQQLYEKQQQSLQRGCGKEMTPWSSFVAGYSPVVKPARLLLFLPGPLRVDGAEPMNLASQSGDAGGSQLLFANFNQDNT